MARGVRIAAKEAMQSLNYDPLEVLVKYAQESGTSPAAKCEVAMALLPYMYPKLSSMTIEADVLVDNQASNARNALMRRVLENPELADAAARLSIAAAEASIEDFGEATIQ